MAFPRPAEKTGMEAVASKSDSATRRAPLFSRKGAAPALVAALSGPPKGAMASESTPLADLEARIAKIEGFCKGMGMDYEEGESGPETESPAEEVAPEEETE